MGINRIGKAYTTLIGSQLGLHGFILGFSDRDSYWGFPNLGKSESMG